ncbi:putative elongation factor Ts [Pillotina sp. SPG140]|jgi:elongation factor Ts
MAINAAEVKMLREKTGAGVLECKNALVEAEGDSLKAEKILKEKGLAALEKRTGRVTNEGKIFIKEKDNTAVVVELASETDFVARNPDFIQLGETIATIALEKNYTEINEELVGLVQDLATKIRENMSLKRLKVINAAPNEILVRYIHGDGAIGVVLSLAVDNPELIQNEELRTVAFNLALHVAAFNPMVLDRSQLDLEFLKEQTELFRKQIEGDAELAKKPSNVLENILKGKVNNYIREICFVDQPYVKDEHVTVAQLLAEEGKKHATHVRISTYIYFKVGQ